MSPTDPTAAPTADRRATTGAMRRIRALTRAEFLQFRRNTAVLANALIFPLAMPVGAYLIFRRQDETAAAATAIEIFLMMALLFVAFYSVLSMATNRRDEGVLKRLRCGQARDGEIIVSLAAPGALISLGLAVAVVAALAVLGAPPAVSMLPFLVALIEGIVLSVALALLTSSRTRNAEAAQITSLPVVMLAMVSLGSVRGMLPERIGQVIDRTPYALISDLAQLGWSGRTFAMTTGGRAALESGELLARAAPMIGLLSVWTVVALVLIPRQMRWDDRA